MAKRYRLNILGSFDREGVQTFFTTGESVTLGGVAYVRQGNTLVEDGPHWHDTREDAQRAAADNVAAIGQTILAQAERFRAQEPK